MGEAFNELAIAVSTGGTTLILSCTLLLNGMNWSIEPPPALGLGLGPALAPPAALLPPALSPHMCSPIMEISTWFPHDEHFIVGMKVDSLGAPAILLVGVESTSSVEPGPCLLRHE